MQDVRPLRQSTRSPAAQTERFHQLLAGSREAVLLTDQTGALLAASSAACALLGRSERELRGLRYGSLVEAPDALVEPTGGQSDEGSIAAEVTLVRGDGSTFLAEVICGAALHDNTAPPLTPLIVRDLSAQRSDQAELQQCRQRFDNLRDERIAEMREAATRTHREAQERRSAEAAAQASEARYRLLSEASPDMIYIVGSDLVVQYVNSKAARRFGLSAKKLVGKPLAELFAGPVASRIVAAVEGVLASGKPHEADGQIAYPDDQRWVNTRLVALKDGDRVSGVLGVSHDVTERKHAQDALAESERRYRSLFEDSPVAMWEEDHSAVKTYLAQLVVRGVDDVAKHLHEHPAEHRHCLSLVQTLAVNQAAVALFEASSPEELIERQTELYPRGYVGGLRSFWAAILAGARSAAYEEVNLTLGGRRLQVLETCTVAPGHEERCDRIYLADVDVSERQRAAELLAKYQLLAKEARDVMLYARTTDGRIVEANAAAETTYGYSREELLQLSIHDLRRDAGGPSHAEQVAAAVDGGIVFETVHYHKDGSAVPVEVSSRGKTTIAGDDVILSVIRDATTRKEAEREVARTTARRVATLQAVVTALGSMAERRDPFVAGHQRRVAALACAIAGELGWDVERIEALRTAALLHDIGKIVVPAEILSKPGKLSAIEFELIRQHASAGAEILADIDFEDDVAGMVCQHHERLDGSGYPAGLKNGEILPEASVLAVADVVEAMISHRPYRPALPLEAALSEIEAGRGCRYDSDACDACLRLMREQRFAF